MAGAGGARLEAEDSVAWCRMLRRTPIVTRRAALREARRPSARAPTQRGPLVFALRTNSGSLLVESSLA
jgi:hypothetical protein